MPQLKLYNADNAGRACRLRRRSAKHRWWYDVRRTWRSRRKKRRLCWQEVGGRGALNATNFLWMRMTQHSSRNPSQCFKVFEWRARGRAHPSLDTAQDRWTTRVRSSLLIIVWGPQDSGCPLSLGWRDSQRLQWDTATLQTLNEKLLSESRIFSFQFQWMEDEREGNEQNSMGTEWRRVAWTVDGWEGEGGEEEWWCVTSLVTAWEGRSAREAACASAGLCDRLDVPSCCRRTNRPFVGEKF